MTKKDQQNGEKNLEPVKISRKEHDRLRRRAIAFERNNAQFILLIPCDGGKGWYEMGNQSALFYKYAVCDKIGVDVVVKDDFDSFFNQFDLGRVRTQHIETVRDNLKRAKMYKDEIEKDNSIIFKFPKAFSDKQIAEIIEDEKRHQAQINEIVKVKLIDPAVMATLTEISARLHRLCLRRMDKVSRDTNGKRVVERCDKAIAKYYQMADTLGASGAEILAMWQDLRAEVHRLLIELQIIVDLKIWKRSQIVAIGEEIFKLEERIDAHIRKTQEKNRTSKSKSSSGRNASAGAKKVATCSAD